MCEKRVVCCVCLRCADVGWTSVSPSFFKWGEESARSHFAGTVHEAAKFAINRLIQSIRCNVTTLAYVRGVST